MMKTHAEVAFRANRGSAYAAHATLKEPSNKVSTH
jgi:hypothetical protein